MFLESSRYFKQKTVDVITKTGRQVNVHRVRGTRYRDTRLLARFQGTGTGLNGQN